MNWKIGQKLVCIENTNKSWDYACPVKGEIVTFDGTAPRGLIYLVEYAALHPTHGFRFAITPFLFRPLQGDDAKESLINSFVEIKETSDAPMLVPEKETA